MQNFLLFVNPDLPGSSHLYRSNYGKGRQAGGAVAEKTSLELPAVGDL
jgi:hypothetical protein